MRILVLFISTVAIVAVGAFAYAWRDLSKFLSSPKDTTAEPKVIMVPAGADLPALARIMEAEGLVRPSPWLELYVEHLHRAKKDIVPGEYSLAASMTPVQQVAVVESGKVVTHTISIPPGARSDEVVDIIVEAGLGERGSLVSLIADEDFARMLKLPGPTLEGYLFPDAYDFPRGLDPDFLLARFAERFRAAVGDKVLERGQEIGLSPSDVVRLASIVEMTKVSERERRLYTAMLINRVKANVPLDVEATAAYGARKLGPGEHEDNPWSTTGRPGLPATPIGSPSLDAINDVVQPATSDALYMVARGDGSHVWCPDLECYAAALARWQNTKIEIPKKKRRRKSKR